MPYPSKGCRTCKRRKVKCDKSRPYCRVCQKVGRECLGYDAEVEGFIFRTEVSGKTGATYRRSDLTGGEHETKVSKTLPMRTPRAQGQDQQLQAALCMMTVQPPIEEQALCFYWSYYLGIRDRAFGSGMRSYVRFYLLANPEEQEPVFKHAVATDSLLLFGKLKHNPRAVALAHKAYSAGLSEARSSLEHSSQTCSDMFLISVMIFSGYEIKSDNTRNPRKGPLDAKCLAHQQGAISLLKLRQDPSYAIHINRSVDRSVRRQILRSCILRAWELPDWLGAGANFGESFEELDMDRCLVEVIHLRCQSQKVFDALRTGAFPPGSFQELIQEVLTVALRIDFDLQIILGRLRKAHSYEILYHKDVEENSGIGHLIFNNKIHIYHTEQSSNLWNSHRAARLICNSIIVAMRRYYIVQLGGVSTAVFDTAKATLSSLIDDVCESLSFHFMDYNPIAFLRSSKAAFSDRSLSIDTERSEALVSVLIIASSTVCLDGVRKAWIKKQLGCIGKLMGSDTVTTLAS